MKKQIIDAGKTINKILGIIGFKIVRCNRLKPGGYISAKETIESAAINNQTVTDYVETMWQEQGIAKYVINSFNDFGVLSPSTKRVCEIGTGTGMFAEAILKSDDISHYESYEIDKDWAEWLSRTYKIVSLETDGENLKRTVSHSIDLIHANGVLVYTPFIVTCKYFFEMFRVTKKDGFAVFDILSEDCFDEEFLNSWLSSPHRYPCILPKEYVKNLFFKNGFSYKGEFFRKFGEGKSLYLIFKKE